MNPYSLNEAGVPVLPGLVIDDDELLRDATKLTHAAAEVGYPLLVKAAFGGGGRGMRIVESPDVLAEAVASARREAESAFGNGTVFLERFVRSPRHIEVQIVGDRHGTVTHLFERECSIQRRFQKIVEEAPSPAVNDRLRADLGLAAVNAGKAIGYVGAGTVEFVMDQDGKFYFLEVNTRLQVEHPVTELVTGLDLVALQLRVAEGHPLPAAAVAPSLTGHAIEVRLYAEDPLADYTPGSGTLHRFEVPDLPGIRVDTGVRTGSVIGTRYDPMVAKVIAHAPTREEAARLLARALSEARLHGLTTNRDLLVGILRHEEFLAGQTDTGFLGRWPPVGLSASPSEELVQVHAAAAALSAQQSRRAAASAQRTIPSGFRNAPSQRQRTEFVCGERAITVDYSLGRENCDLLVDGEALASELRFFCAEDRVTLELDGRRSAVSVASYGTAVYCDSPGGSSVLHMVEKLPEATAKAAPGSLFAPMPGTVVRVCAALGDRVEEGVVIAVFEAMKMEHSVRAPGAGIVTEIRVAVHETVEVGDLIAVIADAEDVTDGEKQ